MVLLARIVIFLASCTILNIVNLCESGEINDDSDSDADRILRDALLLIHVIRTENLKSNLCKSLEFVIGFQTLHLGEALNASAVAELLSSYQNTISVASPSLPRDPLNVSDLNNTFSPTQRAEQRRNIATHELHRRKMSNNRDNAHYRRQYVDEGRFGDSSTATSTTASTVTSTSKTTTAEIIAATITSATIPSVSPRTATSQSFRKTKKIAKTLKYAQHSIASQKQKLRMAKQADTQNGTQQTKIRSDSQAKDPIIFQVKSELGNELKGVSNKKNVKILLKVKGPESAGPTKVPSTLRIHLKSSSRYPIPFPENHALCYTDPKNSLCRSTI